MSTCWSIDVVSSPYGICSNHELSTYELGSHTIPTSMGMVLGHMPLGQDTPTTLDNVDPIHDGHIIEAWPNLLVNTVPAVRYPQVYQAKHPSHGSNMNWTDHGTGIGDTCFDASAEQRKIGRRAQK
jgi:hypothetical protein